MIVITSLATLYLACAPILTEGFSTLHSISSGQRGTTRKSQCGSDSSHPEGKFCSSHSGCFMAKGGPSTGDFEYEELKAQMKAMQTAKLTSDSITFEKRRELQGYVEGVLQKRMSPISLTEMDAFLARTSWRLSFSTEAFASLGLPQDATVLLEFVNDVDANYSLIFGEKTFGIDRLNAASKWRCGTNLSAQDTSRAGVVTLTYDKISTDILGLTNVGVGFFGLLKGRSNYIQTVYFDGDLWIEEGYDPNGEQYYNVYVKQD